MDNTRKVYVGNGNYEEVANETAGLVYSGVHDQYIYNKGSLKLTESGDCMVNTEEDLKNHGRFINEAGDAELATSLVWDGCDAYVISAEPIFKGAEKFEPKLAKPIQMPDEEFWDDSVGCTIVGNQAYQFL